MPRSACWPWPRPGRWMNCKRPGGPAARADRVCLGSRPRRPAAAAQGRQAARVAGPGPGARDLSEAWMAALFVGRFAGVGDVDGVPRRMGPAPPPRRAPADLVLDALAMLVTEGSAAGTPALRQSLPPSSDRTSPPRRNSAGGGSRERPPGPCGTTRLGTMLLRQVQLARDVGALNQLPIDLASLGTATACRRAGGGLGSDRGGRGGPRRDREPPAPFAAMLLASAGATRPKRLR